MLQSKNHREKEARSNVTFVERDALFDYIIALIKQEFPLFWRVL